MAAAPPTQPEGSLLAVIGDEVHPNLPSAPEQTAQESDIQPPLSEWILKQYWDTVTGFLLAGVGNVDLRKKTNYLVVNEKTTVKAIEEAFKEFTSREDIAIVLINQYIASMIRHVVDNFKKPIPALLEIPSKEHPYDASKDSILSRVAGMLGGEDGV